MMDAKLSLDAPRSNKRSTTYITYDTRPEVESGIHRQQHDVGESQSRRSRILSLNKRDQFHRIVWRWIRLHVASGLIYKVQYEIQLLSLSRLVLIVSRLYEGLITNNIHPVYETKLCEFRSRRSLCIKQVTDGV